MKILIVDDEPKIREAFSRWFKGKDHEVLVAETAEEALSTLDNGLVPEVVISDHALSPLGLTGFALLRKVRERLPNCKIILSSGSDVEDTCQAENIPFIAKPNTPREIATALGI